MPRAIWKGAISFGLVHIPVSLVSATSSQGVDFDWLDKRSMDPVGYKRINKATGKEVTKDNIVKGVAFEKGRYVVLSEEEIQQLIEARNAARARLNFEEADRIRDVLRAAGIGLMDEPGGRGKAADVTTWKYWR